MRIQFKCYEKLEDKALLDEFEELIDWKLPKDFRRFVRKYNAAQMELNITYGVCFRLNDQDCALDRFMNFNRSSEDLGVNCIWEWYDFIDDDYEYFEEENLAEKYGELCDYFAFAYTPSDCKICFNKKNGGVYYFDTDDCSLTKIADNFTKFVKGLYIVRD